MGSSMYHMVDDTGRALSSLLFSHYFYKFILLDQHKLLYMHGGFMDACTCMPS